MTEKNRKRVKKTLKRKLSNDNRVYIVRRFLETLNCIKLYHWSTYSYSQHIATDELYHDLNKYIDEFVEIMLGKTKQRIKHIQLKSMHDVASKKKFLSIMADFKKFLIDLKDVLNPVTDTNLFNIRDEILGNVDKLTYLFELR